jgi:hypothetical protein
MKSPMVETLQCVTNKSGYSELQVLRSPAGWYVGTLYWNTDEPTHHYEQPGSRDSCYFRTEDEAKEYLRLLEAANPESINNLRLNP